MSTLIGRTSPLDRVRSMYLKLSDLTQSFPDRLPGMKINQLDEYTQLFGQYCESLTESRQYLEENASRLGLEGLVPAQDASLDELEVFAEHLVQLEGKLESILKLKRVRHQRTGVLEKELIDLIDRKQNQLHSRIAESESDALLEAGFEQAAQMLLHWIEQGSQLSDDQFLDHSELIEAHFGRRLMLLAARGQLELIQDDDATRDNAIFGD